MKLTDTHNHLYLEEFDPDREELIRHARETGIGRIFLPNVDLSTVDRLHGLWLRHPDFFRPMMGLHPTSVDASYGATLRKIESCFDRYAYDAIGEIGLDLYWDKTYLREQLRVFEEQLRWSLDLNLPVAIHCREAFPYTLECIHKVGPDRLRGVFHSFTGSADDWKEIEKLPGFMIGINGVVTFKNSGLGETLRRVDPGRIVLETDAPYLAPAPYRGRRNEPHYIWKTAEKVAEICSLTLEQTAEITEKNSRTLFGVPNRPDPT